MTGDIFILNEDNYASFYDSLDAITRDIEAIAVAEGTYTHVYHSNGDAFLLKTLPISKIKKTRKIKFFGIHIGSFDEINSAEVTVEALGYRDNISLNTLLVNTAKDCNLFLRNNEIDDNKLLIDKLIPIIGTRKL